MTASFDRQEFMARLAELEKCALKRAPSSRLATAPTAQLNVDLAAILTSVKSKSASESAAVEEAARRGDETSPDRSPGSQSKPINPVLEKLRAFVARFASGPSRSRQWAHTAPTILIVIGVLVGGAGFLVGGQVLMALQGPTAVEKFVPPLKAAAEAQAQAPTAELTADAGADASETAALAPQPTPAAVTPSSAARVESPASAAASSRNDGPVAKPVNPIGSRKKPPPDKSEKHGTRAKRHAKAKAAMVARTRGASGAAAEPPAETNGVPDVLSQARQAVGSIRGTVKGWTEINSGTDP